MPKLSYNWNLQHFNGPQYRLDTILINITASLTMHNYDVQTVLNTKTHKRVQVQYNTR